MQPKLVTERFEQHYSDQINLVVAPVYAIDVSTKPRFPLVDWGLYLVEPYAHWVPKLKQTQLGWGIAAPEVVLVNAEGTVLYRGAESFNISSVFPIFALFDL